MTLVAAATAAAGPAVGKQVGTLLVKLADAAAWRWKAAFKALRKTGRPRPVRLLAAWLTQPQVHEQFVLAPALPAASASDIERALSGHARWARLPSDVRRERARDVAAALYDTVVSEQPASRAVQVSTARNGAYFERQAAVLAEVKAGTLRVEAGQAAVLERGDRALLDDRMTRLPPTSRAELLRAWDEDQALAWRLADALGHPAVDPRETVAAWQDVPPGWLDGAGPAVSVAVAGLAGAYGAERLSRALLLNAARQGAPDRQVLAARVAIAHGSDHLDEARAALAVAGTAAESPVPFVRASDAFIHRDWDRLRSILSEWQPSDDRDRVRHWLLSDSSAFLSAGSDVKPTDLIPLRITPGARLLERSWNDGVALEQARRLTYAAVLGVSARPHADLREAMRLALKVRDGRRGWRGDSGEAVAAACEAALHAGDHREALRLGTVDGAATPQEADHPQVLAKVAIAAAVLGQSLAELDLTRLPEHQRQVVLAQSARINGTDAEGHWRAALTAATSEPERATALGGLASTGSTDLPGMEEFEAEHPLLAAVMLASGELARGEHASAVARLRGRASADAQVAALLARAYEEGGDTDAAVETLKQAEATFADPDLGFAAALALHRVGRDQEAAQEARRVLAAASDAWPGRSRALAFAAAAAAQDGDLPAAADLLASCIELDPTNAERRWDLVRLHLARADAAAAWRVHQAHPQPLEPQDSEQARAWLQLHHAHGTATALAAGAVDIAGRFPEDEQVVAAAVAAVLMPRNYDEPLEEGLLNAVQTMTARYIERWPDGAIRSVTVDADNPEALLARIGDMARLDPTLAQARRQVERQVASGKLPLGALSAMSGRPHAAITVARGLGLLQSVHADSGEHARSVADATAALGGACIIETTAVAALLALRDADADALVRAFRLVETVDETLADARKGRDHLAGRSTLVVGWDQEADRMYVQETTYEEADRLAAEAEALFQLVEGLHRRQSERSADLPAHEPGNADPGPWLPAAETAAALGRPLWSDDAALRALARALGAPAFGTAAVLDAAAALGTLPADRRDILMLALLAGRVAIPLTEDLLAHGAEHDAWQPGAAAAALGDAAVWTDPGRALSLLRIVLPRVAQEQPGLLPAWAYRCARGVGHAHPRPLDAAKVSGVLVAAAVQLASVGPHEMPDLLAAVRAGLRDAAPDPEVVPDPLLTAAQVLLGAMRSSSAGLSPFERLTALFAALDDHDREAVEALLDD